MWKAKTISQVCKSAKTTETRGCEKAMEDSVYLARCIHKIYTGERGLKSIPVQMITDSQSLIGTLNFTKQVEEKLIRPIVKWMKQIMDSNAVEGIRWFDTDVCVADVFLKSGSKLSNELLEVFRTSKMVDLKYLKKRLLSSNEEIVRGEFNIKETSQEI